MSDFVTYRHIRDALNELSDEQLDMTASIYESDTMEVFGISDTYTVENLPDRHREELDGVVEDNQPLFVVGFLNQEHKNKEESGYVYAVSKSLGVEVGEWKVNLVVDDDGHLGVFIGHKDGTEVISCDADICSDSEWGERFTTAKIEKDYSAQD